MILAYDTAVHVMFVTIVIEFGFYILTRVHVHSGQLLKLLGKSVGG